MNHFGFIDYEKPIGKKNDYRTSSYLSHVFLDDTMMTHNRYMKRDICKAVKIKADALDEVISEQRENYNPKGLDPYEIRNPKMTSVKHMIPCEDRFFRLPPQPLLGLRSVYNTDFKGSSEEKVEPPISNDNVHITPIKLQEVVIDTAQPGYFRHLDASATTTKLSYHPYTREQIATYQGGITYWSWLKDNPYVQRNVRRIEQPLCNKLPSQKCPKRLHEYPKELKPVPKMGMTTEARRNYKRPVVEIEFEYRCPANLYISTMAASINTKTENNIYGSGDPVAKYVNISGSK